MQVTVQRATRTQPFAPSGSVAGTLVRDGSATSRQLSLIISDAPATATARVRIRIQTIGTWSDWVPMYRTVPASSATPPWPGGIAEVLAVVLFHLNDGTSLQPGTAYDVGLEKTDGVEVDNDEIYTFTTRSLPSETLPTPTTIIAPGDNVQTAISGANADAAGGQIYVLFQRGDHGDVSAVDWPANLSGASDAVPTIIAGEDRFSTFFDTPTNAAILNLDNNLSNVVFQDFTCFGIGTDGAVPLGASSLCYSPGTADLNNVTFRRITATGIRQGIYSRGPLDTEANSSGVLGYDLTLIGTLVWNETNLRTLSYGWDHYGISCAGEGHEFFNCYLELFGDGFSPTTNAGGDETYRDRNQFCYWSRLDRMFDDGFEADGAYRCLGFYENILTNCTNLMSSDPVYGGPVYVFRNCCANTLETRMLKLNDFSAGLFVVQNTLMFSAQINRPNAIDDAEAHYYQVSNSVTISDFVFANNILCTPAGTAPTLYNIWFEAGLGRREFFNNAYFPDVGFQILSINESSLAAAQAAAPAADGFHYYPSLQMFDGSVVTVAQPLSTTFTFGVDAFVGYEDELTFADFAANHASVQNSGRSLPGITDGFSGLAPDSGANVAGMPTPTVGDTHNAVPRYMEAMRPLDVIALEGALAPDNGLGTMDDVTPNVVGNDWFDEDVELGTNGRQHVVNAYSGGAGCQFATLSDGTIVAFLWINGGGHNDSGSNGGYIYILGTVRRLPTGFESPLDISDIDDSNNTLTNPVYDDGKWPSVHTYAAQAYLDGIIYRLNGARYSPTGGMINDFWTYDTTAVAGSRESRFLTDFPSGVGSGSPLAFVDETTRKVICLEPGLGGHIYDIDTPGWSSEVGLTLETGFDFCGGYDATRNLVLIITRSNGVARTYTFNLTTDQQTASATVTFTGALNILNNVGSGNNPTPNLLHDAVTDRWYAWGGQDALVHDTLAYCSGADIAAGGNVAVTEVALSADMLPNGHFTGGYIGSFNRYAYIRDIRRVITLERVDEGPRVFFLPVE